VHSEYGTTGQRYVRPKLVAGYHLDGEFLAAFPDHRVRGAFPRLDPAAGQLPTARGFWRKARC
jgi:hypothetical protein